MSHVACTVDFSYEGVNTCALDEAQITDVCDLVLAEEGVERPCFISITLVTDARMRELNAQWRGIDRATDVLSLECERPDDPDLAEGEPCQLGDVVLAPAYIARQAAAFGVTPYGETTLLLVHGLLHLLGYDHVEESEAQIMEQREDQLVALCCDEEGVANATLTRHSEERRA